MANIRGKSVGDVAKLVGVQTHTIRFWQKNFNHIQCVSGPGDRKYYDDKAIEQFKYIKELMYHHGMKISGIQKLVRYGKISTNGLGNHSTMKLREAENNALDISSQKIDKFETIVNTLEFDDNVSSFHGVYKQDNSKDSFSYISKKSTNNIKDNLDMINDRSISLNNKRKSIVDNQYEFWPIDDLENDSISYDDIVIGREIYESFIDSLKQILYHLDTLESLIKISK